MEIRTRLLKDETILEIGRFAVLWNLFERSYFRRRCNACKIKNNADRFRIDSNIQEHFAKQLNARCELLGQDIHVYVRKSLHDIEGENLNEEYVAEMVRFLQYPSDDTTCGCLLAVCRIRNNLMHGIKDIKELDDQIELFRAANEVLENVERS